MQPVGPVVGRATYRRAARSVANNAVLCPELNVLTVFAATPTDAGYIYSSVYYSLLLNRDL